jgi:hypothetical protein
VYNRRRPELTALHRIIQTEFPRVERLCREAGDGQLSAARNNRRNPVKSALAAMSERASSAGVGVA